MELAALRLSERQCLDHWIVTSRGTIPGVAGVRSHYPRPVAFSAHCGSGGLRGYLKRGSKHQFLRRSLKSYDRAFADETDQAIVRA